DALPVVAAHAEDGGAAGGAARAVDTRHLRRLDAEIVAEGRVRGLRFAQLALLHDREARQVLQRLQGVRRDARRFPLAAVEGALLPGVADLRAQLAQDDLVELLAARALD